MAELLAFPPGDVVRALKDLFQEVPNVMFCVKDREGRYVAVNRAFEARAKHPYGPGRESVIGRTAQEVFGEKLGSQYELQDAEIWDSGSPMHRELDRIFRRDRIHEGFYLTTKALLGKPDEASSCIISISVDLNERAGGDAAARTVRDAITWIHDHIQDSVRVADIARAVGVKSPHLASCFKRVLDLPPGSYVREYRLEMGVRDIRRTDLKFADIAYKWGFSSPGTLSTAVKKATGHAPRDLRTQYRREHPR